MKICVCVKQVPETDDIRIDPDRHTLIRGDAPGILNPFDAYALEAAVCLKETAGGEVVVLSMGPGQAREMLRECLARGADRGYLISGAEFGGSDTLATSYVLACAVRTLEQTEIGKFDLILCGKQAVDGDTAQVGPEIAERLNLPQVTCALDLELQGRELHIKREYDEGYDILSVRLPALVTVSRLPFEPRYPTLSARLASREKEISLLTAQDLNAFEASCCGLTGSPTHVRSTYVPVREKKCILLEGIPAEEAAGKLAGYLFGNRLASGEEQ